MANELRFDGRVAIVTGAGGGLGRAHALLLGSRGCKVVVNDLGGSMHGGGQSSTPAEKVVDEIKKAGGEAVPNYDSVEAGDKIVKTALDTWGRIDIIVNNAGILRDTSFQKLTQEDWDLIYRVHVLGSFRVTHAAWNAMRDAGYGRIIFTASAAGIYGNFGQANYSMAKLGLLGLSNTLAIEGRKRGILVNTIAPLAGSRLTETVLPKELVDALRPEFVSPLVAYLAHESCKETGGLFEVGGGFFSKLRWERTEGKLLSIGRPITPEAVEQSWKEITDFSKSTHPPDITQSMGPVIENINKKSKGGNEFIDVDKALGYEFPPLKTTHTERDIALYALGVGAAADPLDPKELQYVYELHPDGFLAMPTFGVVPVVNAVIEMAKRGEQAPGMNYGFERILHGEQYLELKRPIPPSGTLTHKSKIKDIWDKGKNAVVVTAATTYDESGAELLYNELTMVVRGAGGWGGDRGPSGGENAPPDRAPDAVSEQVVSPSQALLYRLSGDWNPLHADPSFAKNFGFPRPVLHGLCTFGYAGHAVIKAFSGNDPRYFKSIRVRFAESVFPGETLVTEMWKESDTRILFRTKVKERDKVVITSAAVELFKEIPTTKKKAEAPKAASAPVAPAPAAAAEPTSADIFTGVQFYVESHPELVSRVGTVFCIKLTSPESAWTIDVKNGKGKVARGVDPSAEVTLELADADFMGMAAGKLNPQKLFLGGKLKITGNVMAAQKLDFLTKVDPEKVREAMQAQGRLPSSAPAPTAKAPEAPAATDKLTSGDIFVAIRDYIERTPDLAGKISTIFQFKLKAPESAWVVDLKSGKGAVTAGTATADVTLELSDDDFLAMTTGAADPQKLFLAGKLKISGNIMASQKLMFLKNVKPAEAQAAIEAARKAQAGPAQAASASPAPKKESAAKAIMSALGERIAKSSVSAGSPGGGPSLIAEVAAVIAFHITDPEAAFTVDLKNAPGGVKEGAAKDATTTLKLAEEDLIALARGGSAEALHQQGKLRIDGEVRPAHKLAFLKGLV